MNQQTQRVHHYRQSAAVLLQSLALQSVHSTDSALLPVTHTDDSHSLDDSTQSSLILKSVVILE